MGGFFGITDKIVADLDLRKRCFNTPISETAIVGAAIGYSQTGFLPIAEIQ